MTWRVAQANQLLRWMDEAPRDGLPAMDEEAQALRTAIAAGDAARITALADAAAERLLDRHRNGTHAA
ncbi:MAG: L,D-transpeptidase, partial [Sphingopyxis sp.]|nr:L,D-transpeptidase [Sphingopyxis sp.]